MRPANELPLNREFDYRMAMAEQERSMSHPVINQPHSVNRRFMCSRGVLDEDGEGQQMPRIVRDSARETIPRTGR